MNALILFIKPPELGKVKTRLARTMGKERALAIYQALLSHTREVALEVDAVRYVYYAGELPIQDEWPESHFHKARQWGADIGERMHRALAEVLKDHPRALLVGGDIPGLKSDIVEEGFRLLEEKDCVFGPARDGGYYLVGMNQPMPELFSGIPWSSARVLEESLHRVKGSWSLLPILADIDTESDWEQFGWDI